MIAVLPSMIHPQTAVLGRAGGRIFSDVKFSEEAFELIFLIDVVIVFEHGDCKALSETARAYEEEIFV